MSSVLENESLAVVDIETTGSRARHDRIIEIGILRIEQGSVVRKYEQLINPQTYLSPFIQNMTGIQPSVLEEAPVFEHVKEEIHELLDSAIFVAHNARFDYNFLKNEFQRYGMDIELKQLCTVKLSRYLFPGYRHHNLDAIIKRFDIACSARHRAFGDAEATWHFIEKVSKRFDTGELDTILNQIIKTQSLPRHISTDQINQLPNGPGIYIFWSSDGAPLYVGKSTHIRERVLSHFARDFTSSKEMAVLEQLHHIEHQSTAGELSALLLEAKHIKRLKPIYNRMLRETSKITFALRSTSPHQYTVAKIHESDTIDPAILSEVLGIYKSKKQARETLASLARKHLLCHKLLDLEKTSKSCFAHKIGTCHGACIRKELPIAYNIRFIQAFSASKIPPWPYPGAIQITEYNEDLDLYENIYVNNWCIIDDPYHKPERFEIDTYHILRRFIMKNTHQKNIKILSHEVKNSINTSGLSSIEV